MINLDREKRIINIYYKEKLVLTIDASLMTKFFLTVIVILVGYIGYIQNASFKEADFGVEKDNLLLLYFEEEFPNNPVIKCKLGDVNNDGRDDLIIIYQMQFQDGNELRVVFDTDNGYEVSNQNRAPYENQTIELIDIDNSPPMEFIVSGSKRGRYGYEIYRVDNSTQLASVFGEGMDVC